MPATTSVIAASGLGFAWPDGTEVLSDLDLLVSPGRSGLVGVNGAGKSTLLRLVAGALRPTAGHLSVAGEVGYLPQDLTLDVHEPVEEFLGIGAVRRAIRAVESGDVDPAHFDTIGDASARSPAARPPSSGWPGCCCAGPTCCCSTSRPTTSTPTRGSASTTSSTAGAARCWSSATTA